MISIPPINIAINAIKNANNLITASGNNLWGKKVSATESGPPITVSEIINVASRANDSMTKLSSQILQYFQPPLQ